MTPRRAARLMDELARRLAGYRRRRARVVDWRLNLTAAESASLGLHNNEPGSVYSPLALHQTLGGAFLVAWSDGRVSRGSLDGNASEDLEERLAVAWEARYRDDEVRQFPGPVRAPRTPLFSRETARLLGERVSVLYAVVDLLLERGRKAGARKVSGGVRASQTWAAIRTSRGLDHAGRSTEFVYSVSLDGDLWDGHSQRRPMGLGALRSRVDRLGALLPHLRRRDRRFRGGLLPVVFHPDFAEEIMDAYVTGNLRGSAVATGQSAFRREAFGGSEPFFREDFHFEVDPTVPFSSGSYRVTGEGLPARRTVYVSGGRLLRPIVGLKDARRLGMEPTTPPRGMESVVYRGRSARSFKRVLAGLERGALVLSALGMHTQDAASGSYSLTAPQALTIRGGRLAGRAKITLSGNAFEQLRSPELGFVTFPGYRSPGLLVMAHVSLEG